MTQFIPKLLYLTKGHYRSLVLVLFLFFLISGLELFGTGMIGPFIAVATNPDLVESNSWLNLGFKSLNLSSKYQYVLVLGLVVAIAFYLKAFLAFRAQLTVFKFGFNLRGELANRLMKSYLEAPYSFHLKVNSANLIQNISGTTDSVCLGVIMPLLTSINNCIIVLALTILLIKVSSMALILIMILSFVVLGILKLTKHQLEYWGKTGWQAATEMIRTINHGLGGFKETRVLGCESYFQNQMQQLTKTYARNMSLAQGYGNLPRYVLEAVMISFLVGFTLVYIHLSQANNESLTAVLGIFALASIRLLPAAGNLVTGVNTIRTNTFAVNKLFFDFQELEAESQSPHLTMVGAHASHVTANKPFQEIRLEQVTFKYPNHNQNALSQISLTIQKGQSIGLIGKSGAGKTTLVDVILGLFTPQSGDIKVDDTSVYKDLRNWQNMLGYVPQSIFLIDDTLERNIAFGVPDHLIDAERLKKAIQMAQLSDVVERLPDGIKTVVGERGVLLSGGQRQRVGIARVLYHEREILVFDEATSALDSETEYLVTEATKALSGIKTIIIIAHRLSTIQHCDQVYQLEGGQVIKSGSFQEVTTDH
jgi:ATP-binding cassette, subfamily B, bacterial PglK